MSGSRVERMFGPRENWGQGDEMAAVRERAVRQEGGGPEIDRHCEAAGRGNPVVRVKKAPSVSKTDSSPMLAHRGAEMPPQSASRQLPHASHRGAEMPPQSASRQLPHASHRGAKGSRGGGAWGGLAGFVSIRCECGKVVNTCLRQRTPVFRCKDCGGETSLEHVSNIHMKCNRCGFTGKYRTNRTEEKIQMECLNCSDIVYLTRIRRGNYVVEGEECGG